MKGRCRHEPHGGRFPIALSIILFTDSFEGRGKGAQMSVVSQADLSNRSLRATLVPAHDDISQVGHSNID